MLLLRGRLDLLEKQIERFSQAKDYSGTAHFADGEDGVIRVTDVDPTLAIEDASNLMITGDEIESEQDASSQDESASENGILLSDAESGSEEEGSSEEDFEESSSDS